MQNKILLIITVMMGLLMNERTIAQIPATGVDFRSMAGLRWGMTIKEARDSIAAKKEIQKTTSATLSYEDTLLSTKVLITLRFVEKGKEMILDFIDVPFIEPKIELVKSIEKYLVSHYGNQYESKKTKQSKFFITLEMEVKTWHLENEDVGLMVCYQGEDVAGINFTYHISKSK